MLESFAHYVQNLISQLGYPGLFMLIALESTMVPIPSELVMPFAGYLAFTGQFSLPIILVVNGIAAMVGSGICYAIGARGGKPFLVRFGKYMFVSAHDLEKTETFFAKHGGWTIFLSRFVPVIRHIISLPAGVARMPLPTFFLQTFLGSSIWGGGLMVLGYYLGKHWENVEKTVKKFNVAGGVLVLCLLGGAAVWFVVRRRRAAKLAQAVDTSSAPTKDSP